MKRSLAWMLIIGLAAFGCGKLPDSSGPDPLPETQRSSGPAPGEGGSDATPSPGLGSPATPSPEPTPGDPDDPEDDPDPDPTPPAGTADCGAPVPPEIARVNVKIHLRGPNAWTLDATPLVGPDATYCAQIGFTDGRQFCPVRPEGHPEREGCETLAVGRAVDTGRAGPTWRRDGALCSGAPSCENHPDNQYFVKAMASGTYEACPRIGACGSLGVSR